MNFKRKITKTEWLEMNGFSEYGVTYLVLGNSYPIKDDLKENGFKFSPLLRWHGDTNDFDLPEGCYYKEFCFDEVFIWNEEDHTVFLREGARDKIEEIFNPKVEYHSDYVGEIGERIRGITVTVRTIGGFNSAYGYKWVYTLEDEGGNLFTWFTTSQQAVSNGDIVSLTGTIKAHVEYKGARTTQLTRCRFEDI
jgi:hypothetical protein